MRQLSTATLAAAVALVFASAAQSATNPSGVPTISSGGPTAQGAAAFNSTPGTPAPSSTATFAQMQRAPNVNVDVRLQQTNAAVAATHASGSTSATSSVLNATSTTSTSTTGTSATGTGTTTGTGTGTTSGTGTGTTSGLGATGTNGAVVLGPLNGGLALGTGNVILANPSDFTNGAVAANGVAGQAYAANDVVGGASLIDTTTVVNGAAPNGASVDRAIRQVTNDRRRIGRNGQLLYTIAPRTNVDRSNEMPDDPLPYSLTGSNSTLTR